MLRIHLFLILVALTGFQLVGSVRAADPPLCSALLYDDKVLLAEIPERLRPIIESARVRSLMVRREEAWADFHQALDGGLAHEGQPFKGRIGEITVAMVFKRRALGDLELSLDLSAKKVASFQVLDFIAAELGWIAKARASGKITHLRIVAEDLKTTRITDFMTSIGFKRGRRFGPRCMIAGLVGGMVGFGGGKLFFVKEDANVENGSIEEDRRKFQRDVIFGSAAGGMTAMALFCEGKSKRGYSLEF